MTLYRLRIDPIWILFSSRTDSEPTQIDPKMTLKRPKMSKLDVTSFSTNSLCIVTIFCQKNISMVFYYLDRWQSKRIHIFSVVRFSDVKSHQKLWCLSAAHRTYSPLLLFEQDPSTKNFLLYESLLSEQDTSVPDFLLYESLFEHDRIQTDALRVKE